MTWSETCFLNRLTTNWRGARPRPKAGNDRLFPESLQRLFVLPIDLGARNRDLQVLLARADIGDVDLDLELALRLFGARLCSPARRSPKQTRPTSSSSVLIKGFPSGIGQAGMA